MARITLNNVNKIYPSRHGDVHAVKDFSLEVAEGEFVALLGPSGCGKTSTLRMIVGLETVTSGDILFDGQRMNEREPRERNVAMAFETYALYPNFTVEENLAFPLEVRGIGETERKAKARRIAEILHLESVLDQKPPSLSGGEQQRVSLGRALIRDPDAFILDEVMSHLDAHLKFQMLTDLKELHVELGKTMIYVTHDQMEAMALADRIAVMDHAKLQQAGSRNELYATPANRFVADFIGEPPTNFFDAEVSAVNGELHLVVNSDGLAFVPSPGTAERIKNNKLDRVVVGVRPQHFRLKAPDGTNTVSAFVHANEYLGERSILTLKNGNEVFRALVPPGTSAKKGEPVTLDYATRDVMVFDAGTHDLIV